MPPRAIAPVSLKEEQLGHLLLRAHRFFAERALAKLTARGHTMLRMAHITLLPHFDKDGVRTTVLAERAGISKQAVGQIVNDLENAGYVTRAEDPEDGRAQRVTLTRKGLALLQDAAQLKVEIEEELAGRLGRHGLAQLRELLIRVLGSPPGKRKDKKGSR